MNQMIFSRASDSTVLQNVRRVMGNDKTLRDKEIIQQEIMTNNDGTINNCPLVVMNLKFDRLGPSSLVTPNYSEQLRWTDKTIAPEMPALFYMDGTIDFHESGSVRITNFMLELADMWYWTWAGTDPRWQNFDLMFSSRSVDIDHGIRPASAFYKPPHDFVKGGINILFNKNEPQKFFEYDASGDLKTRPYTVMDVHILQPKNPLYQIEVWFDAERMIIVLSVPAESLDSVSNGTYKQTFQSVSQLTEDRADFPCHIAFEDAYRVQNLMACIVKEQNGRPFTQFPSEARSWRDVVTENAQVLPRIKDETGTLAHFSSWIVDKNLQVGLGRIDDHDKQIEEIWNVIENLQPSEPPSSSYDHTWLWILAIASLILSLVALFRKKTVHETALVRHEVDDLDARMNRLTAQVTDHPVSEIPSRKMDQSISLEVARVKEIKYGTKTEA